MLGVCPDTILEYIVIFDTQWNSRCLYIPKSTKAKPRFDGFIEKSCLFHDWGCSNGLFIYIQYG